MNYYMIDNTFHVRCLANKLGGRAKPGPLRRWVRLTAQEPVPYPPARVSIRLPHRGFREQLDWVNQIRRVGRFSVVAAFHPPEDGPVEGGTPPGVHGRACDPEPPQWLGVDHRVTEPQDADALPLPPPHLFHGRLRRPSTQHFR